VVTLASETDIVRGQHRGFHVDVVTYLTLWLVLLYGLSARQVVGFVGALGSPALLLTIPAILLWIVGWLLPSSGLRREPHPLRAMLLAYVAFMVFSFSLALSRPLSETALSSAVRGLIILVAMVGVALLAADGIEDESRLLTLLRRLVLLGGASSLLGILQFFTGEAMQLTLPGLDWAREVAVGTRSGFNRTRGNAMHPIEFSVVLAGLLPLAIHFALYDTTIRRRRLAAICVALLALALPTTLSRSGILSAVTGLAILAFAWNFRRLMNAAVTALVMVPLAWLALPGLLEALLDLFADTDRDHSIQARISRVPRIMELVRARPWLGIGAGTHNMDDYFLLDNQFWLTMIETGIVGTALTVLLLLVGILVAASGAPRGRDEARRHLGFAVAGSIAALGMSIATFDAFFYRILTGTLFLLIGVGGALWRLQRSNFQPRVTRKEVAPRGG
jgi:O-antigen ligase